MVSVHVSAFNIISGCINSGHFEIICCTTEYISIAIDHKRSYIKSLSALIVYERCSTWNLYNWRLCRCLRRRCLFLYFFKEFLFLCFAKGSLFLCFFNEFLWVFDTLTTISSSFATITEPGATTTIGT